MTEANQTDQQIAEAAWGNGCWPAYPSQPLDGSGMPCVEHAPGLTKRELFAAMAMQNLATWPIQVGDAKLAAKKAVEFADALLKELNRTEETASSR